MNSSLLMPASRISERGVPFGQLPMVWDRQSAQIGMAHDDVAPGLRSPVYRKP